MRIGLGDVDGKDSEGGQTYDPNWIVEVDAEEGKEAGLHGDPT
jgi:hypothetical protein